MYEVVNLVSIMNIEDNEQFISFLNKRNIKNSVLVNQTKKFIEENKFNVKPQILINDFNRGLSRSRNLCIENSFGDIGIITDDDISFYDNYIAKLNEAYEAIPTADIIIFNVKNMKSKNIPTNRKLNKRHLLKVSSYQISFKIESVKNNQLKFDTQFGAGSGVYKCCEENIFLFDALKKKLKIYYINETICEMDENSSSTWFTGYDIDYFITKGAGFRRLFPFVWPFIAILFSIKKNKIFKSETNFFLRIKYMFNGALKYKK